MGKKIGRAALIDYLVYFSIFIAFIVFIVLALTTNGTGGAGDSTMHFLIAQSAFKHPHLFLDHWGKPLYTLFAAPFSQFGFTGMKIFNSLVACLLILFTYLSAKKLGLKLAWAVVPVLLFSPWFFKLAQSGLTEHFFALVLILGLYFILEKKYLSGIIIYSFLPFARSEGLIIIGAVALYLVVIKKYKLLPWLLTGHVFFSMVGVVFFHKSLLWVFTEIPYANLETFYGTGDFFHYFRNLYKIIGNPNYILLLLGILYFVISFFSKSMRSRLYFYPEQLWLIYGAMGSFFMAHTIFWTFGIFNSAGLERVLIDVIPLMALIIIKGLELINIKSLDHPARILISLSVFYLGITASLFEKPGLPDLLIYFLPYVVFLVIYESRKYFKSFQSSSWPVLLFSLGILIFIILSYRIIIDSHYLIMTIKYFALYFSLVFLPLLPNITRINAVKWIRLALILCATGIMFYEISISQKIRGEGIILLPFVLYCYLILGEINIISPSKYKLRLLSVGFILWIGFFPFIVKGSASIQMKHFQMDMHQQMVYEVAEYVNSNYPDHKYFYTQSAMSLAFDLDHFDTGKREYVQKIFLPEARADKNIIIWDNHFTAVNEGVSLQSLRKMKGMKEIQTFGFTKGDREWKFVVFELP